MILGFFYLRANEYFRTETVKLPKKIQLKCLIFSHNPASLAKGDRATSLSVQQLVIFRMSGNNTFETSNFADLRFSFKQRGCPALPNGVLTE